MDYSKNLANALNFIKHYDLPIFPVRVEDGSYTREGRSYKYSAKAPCVNSPFDKATKDPRRINEWWSYFNGKCAFAAYPGAGGFTVVDIDSHNGDGLAALKVWEQANEVLEETFTVSTPSGGEHRWFIDDVVKGKLDNNKGFIPSVDVHGGPGSDGGYVLLPEQTTSKGVYKIKSQKKMALLSKLFAQGVNNARSSKKSVEVSSGAGAGQVGEWIDFSGVLNEVLAMNPITENRDNTLTAICCNWKEKGMPPETMIRLMETMNALGKIAQPAGDEKDICDFRRIVNSIWKRESTLFGSQTVRRLLTDSGTPEAEGYSAKELHHADLPPIEFLVNGILPEGITMLGGSAKGGKTYLLLDLAISLANGDNFLGRFTPNKLRVLYAYLEGSRRQVKARMEQIRGEEFTPPETLYFVHQLPPLNAGGVTALRSLVEEFQAEVVIIDTWQLVRSPQNSKATAYEKEYAEFANLRNQVFKGMGLKALILAHHLKQFKRGEITDPLSMFNGSAAIGGAVDTAWLLFRERGAESATLCAHGREIEDCSFELVKTEPMGWKISTGGNSIYLVAETEFQKRLVAELGKAPDGITARELAGALPGVQYQSVFRQLDRWYNDGKLDKTGKKYRLFSFVEKNEDDPPF